MIRLLLASMIIVILLATRYVLYGWLRQQDPLPRLARQAFEAVMLYFIYMTVGLLVLSLVAGQGFGRGHEGWAVFITLGMAIYVGVGVFILGLRLTGRGDKSKTRTPRLTNHP